MRSVTMLGVAAVLVLATGCGKSATDGQTSGSATTPASVAALTSTTPAATRDAGKVTWALYRDVGTVDPIQALDYPEQTVVTALCDSLNRQNPDGTISPGLAERFEHPDDRTLVLTLRKGVTFWDGKPLTPADVVYSLQRAADPQAGGFYPAVFTRVKSIAATGADQVTIKLTEPDYWLDGELSQMPGVIYEKAFAEAQGKKLGTPQGGQMCTGPYKIGSWTAGVALSAVRNDRYWDASTKAKVSEIDFKGVPDESSLLTGFATGGVNGMYPQALGGLATLKTNPKVTVTEGPSYAIDAMAVVDLEGPLGDVRVRQALSLALDRPAYIESVYRGAAQLPRTIANPGTWGPEKDVFQAYWDKLPAPSVNLAKAKALVREAGAAGKTITIGMSTESAQINSAANALRSAGDSIGLKVTFKAVSIGNFINFFLDPKFREGIDVLPTISYPDYADPASLYNVMATKGAAQNYSGFEDAKVSALLDKARSTADSTARAELVAQAGNRLAELLPWIPMAAPNTVLITSSSLTGAPASFVYMGGPWANLLGGK